MEEETPRGPVSRTTIVQMVVVGFVASALGIALGLVIDWFPTSAATQADKIDDFWDVLIIASVPVFVLVTIVVLFAVKEFRQRPGEELLDGPPIHGNTRLEVVWTAIPAIILVVLCGYAYKILHDIEKAPAQAAQELKVQVYGQQFTWTFEYREQGKKIKTTRLYLPEGRSVKFEVHSKDVLHDFWIPAMRMKIDAVPGITTNFRVTPNRTGRYPIVCAELCGLGHAFMRQTAYVLPEAEFNDWLEEKLNPAPPAGEEPAAGGQAGADGKAVFTEGNANGATACGSCHQLADAGTGKGIGPNLDDALAGKDAAYIREAIVNPGKEVASGFPANVMPPNYGDVLSPEELDAVVKYLTDATSK